MLDEQHCRLNLFAKSPVAGEVKTRIGRQIGMQKAADIAEWLIDHSVHRARKFWPGPVRLLVWPDAGHSVFKCVSRDHGVDIEPQQPGNLGDKMATVLQGQSQDPFTEAVMGCDVPHLPGSQYQLAAQAMQRQQAVVGRSRDGGFYFLSIPQFDSSSFHGIQWGGHTVAMDLINNLNAIGRQIDQYLQEMIDLDELTDLETVRQCYSPLHQKLSELYV